MIGDCGWEPEGKKSGVNAICVWYMLMVMVN